LAKTCTTKNYRTESKYVEREEEHDPAEFVAINNVFVNHATKNNFSPRNFNNCEDWTTELPYNPAILEPKRHPKARRASSGILENSEKEFIGDVTENKIHITDGKQNRSKSFLNKRFESAGFREITSELLIVKLF